MKRGVNETLNAETLEAVTSQIVKIFAERGFATEVVAKLNGMTYEFDPKGEYMVSEKWRLTDEKYTPIPNDRSIWYADETRYFFTNLVTVAQEINMRRGIGQEGAEKIIAAKEGVPLVPLSERELQTELFNEIDSNIIVFLKIEGRLQGVGKQLASNILIGGIGRALTGGIIPIPSGSYARADAVVFDPQSKLIKWHSEGRAEYKQVFQQSVKSVLQNYPYSDGKTSTQRARKRRLIPPNR